jgi:hypothetical protein
MLFRQTGLLQPGSSLINVLLGATIDSIDQLLRRVLDFVNVFDHVESVAAARRDGNAEWRFNPHRVALDLRKVALENQREILSVNHVIDPR